MTPEHSHGTVVLHEPEARQWLLFERPRRVLSAHVTSEVLPLLEELQDEVEHSGSFAAGFITYEAAPAFDPAFQTRTPSNFPLAWFGLYGPPEALDTLPPASNNPELPDWSLMSSHEPYVAAVKKIQRYIRSGDTYQVNFSVRLRAAFANDPWPLFLEMVRAQGAHYSAFVNTDQWSVCSASPELFFCLKGAELVSRPMKGTAARGLWAADDAERSLNLLNSEKNRAENLMIVDMVRNDVGRVAKPGTVNVERLFELEKYPTLWQMTSTVRCMTAAPLTQIFSALFPAASITGAPKVRTMQIIAELEQTARKIYTGAIGFMAPGRGARFNVAIRTVLVDKLASTAEYGIGGGIVSDSVPEQEFEECKLKMRIVREREPNFDLLETFLWQPGAGFFLLERHLARLAESAEYFCRKICVASVRDKLLELERTFPATPHRVRVTVSNSGAFSINQGPITEPAESYRVTLAVRPVSFNDRFLYHKTTERRVYVQALAERPGYDDVLLWNEKGELTESTIANIVLEKDHELLTPPVSCGLLGGVYRGFLLEQKRIREQVLRVKDLAEYSKLYLINSVRQMWEPSFIAGEKFLPILNSPVRQRCVSPDQVLTKDRNPK